MSSDRLTTNTGTQPTFTMSAIISVSCSGKWMRMLSGVWLGPCHASSIRSPPISRVRRSVKVSSGAHDVLAEQRGRAGMVGVMVGVDQVRHLVAHAVVSRNLVDRALEVMPDARRRIEENDAVRRRQERGLVDAVGDPVEVPLNAPDVVALLVGSRAERRGWNGRVIRKNRRCMGLGSPRVHFVTP